MELLTPKLELFTDQDSIVDDKRYDNKEWNINLRPKTANGLDSQCTSANDCSTVVDAPVKKYKKKRQQCPKCSMSYSKREYLSKHMMNAHNVALEKKKPGRQSAFLMANGVNDPRPYKCDQCVKEYTKSKHLARHRKTHLEKSRCEECNEVYVSYADHMLKKHGIDLPRPFECDICKKTYRTKHNIQSHMRIHRAATRVFTCTVCSKTFNFGTDLRKHIRSHSQSRSIICDICGDAFKSTDTLKCHLRRHTGERPYKCSVCPRAFSTSNSLDIHFRTHTGERPFQCEFCEKRFSDSSTLLVHKRLHTNENPYICHLCGRRTKQASNLRSQYKHFHKNNDITGRQIRQNSRIFNRFTQNEIDAQLHEVGDLMALLERGLIEFDREQKEKSMQIEQSLKETISITQQVKQPYSATDKMDLGIEPPPPENTAAVVKVDVEEDIKVKMENSDTTLALSSPLEPVPPPLPLADRIENETVVKRITRSKVETGLKNVKNVQPKIESVFLEDDEYPLDIDNFSIDDIKNEDNSDDDNWQDDNYENSSHEQPFNILKVESGVDELDEKPNPTELLLNNSLLSNEEDNQSDSDEDDTFFASTKNVAEPKGSICRRPEKERCKECSRKFHDLPRHLVECHSGIDRPYECFICQRMYKRFDHLKLHMKTHGDERNYICHVCGDAFFLSNDLRKHIVHRHQVERPFKCTHQQCKKCFKNQHALNVHFRTHSGVKPYVCAVCSESFAASSSLKIHERKHTGEKPYVCKFCHKAFADCSTHRQHVRIHTGDKPYKCHLCDRRTAQAGNLKSHYRHYHKIIVKSVSMFMDQSTVPFVEEIPGHPYDPNHALTAYPLMDSTRRIEE